LWLNLYGKPVAEKKPLTEAQAQSREKQRLLHQSCPSEDDEQIAFVNWFGIAFPGVLIYAIPNGGSRNRLEALKMKRTGTKPSIPDLHIPEWRLYIEMKRTMFSDKTSDAFLAQLEMHNHLRTQCKETVFLAYGCEDAIRQVNQFRLNRQR